MGAFALLASVVLARPMNSAYSCLMMRLRLRMDTLFTFLWIDTLNDRPRFQKASALALMPTGFDSIDAIQNTLENRRCFQQLYLYHNGKRYLAMAGKPVTGKYYK